MCMDWIKSVLDEMQHISKSVLSQMPPQQLDEFCFLRYGLCEVCRTSVDKNVMNVGFWGVIKVKSVTDKRHDNSKTVVSPVFREPMHRQQLDEFGFWVMVWEKYVSDETEYISKTVLRGLHNNNNLMNFGFWPTVLSVEPLVHCVVSLSVCHLWRFVLWQNGTS